MSVLMSEVGGLPRVGGCLVAVLVEVGVFAECSPLLGSYYVSTTILLNPASSTPFMCNSSCKWLQWPFPCERGGGWDPFIILPPSYTLPELLPVYQITGYDSIMYFSPPFQFKNSVKLFTQVHFLYLCICACIPCTRIPRPPYLLRSVSLFISLHTCIFFHLYISVSRYFF